MLSRELAAYDDYAKQISIGWCRAFGETANLVAAESSNPTVSSHA